uniref:DDE Tnp4 domain-containing protein n=1 Tax=Anopheles dirus TaxID=7168 RepID=A0A182NQA9_9DIPT
MLHRRAEAGNRVLADIGDEAADETIRKFLRMNEDDFEFLLRKIHKKIVKKDTHMRKAITSRERLIITLRFLATGESYQSLHFLFRLPATENEWLQVSQRFEEKWQFPHANGAIDGKHIRIKNPKHSGSEYYNYKHFYSIVLLGIVDADYNFLYVDIGGKGGVLDGGIFRNAKINEKLERKQLNIPQPSNLQESNSVPVPYMLLGDKAFAFTDFCIRPFGGTPAPGSAESVFNSSLSRARMSVEIAFGILSNTFRVLHTPMYLEPHVSRKIVMTAVHLHNFIRNRN